MSKLQDLEDNVNLESQCKQIRQEYLEDEELIHMKEQMEVVKAKKKIRVPKYVPEPQVTSKNSEERILARRLRILKRLQYRATKAEPEKEVKESPLQMQINKAYEKLNFIEEEVVKPVENIRLASEVRESRREKAEGTRGRKRRGDLDDMAKESLAKFQELCDGWHLILKENENPLALRNNLLEHRQKCQEFLDHKEAIIEQLKLELQITNEKIDKDQVMSRMDLNAIGYKTMSQVNVMKRAYDHYIELIQKVSDEQVINEVRKLENQVEELRRLRNLKQLKYEKKIVDFKINFEKEMTNNRREMDEEFNNMKKELEHDQLDMEFVFSDILGQCVVNAAKIYYNVEVLKGRVVENEYLITNQAHRVRSFSTQAKFLHDEINRLEKEMVSETDRIHKAARTLYRRIMENLNRSLISTAANDKKYRDMWKYNRSTIMNLANRVLLTDRVIHEQYLGLKWTPALDIWTEMDEFDIMPSYSEAFRKFNTKLNGKKPKDTRCDTENSLEKPRGERDVPVFIPVWKACEEPSTQEDQQQQAISLSSTEIKKDQFLTSLMEHISDTSAFIVGQRLLDLIEPYDSAARDVVKLDALFRVLGAENEELLPVLKSCFLPYATCLVCQKRRTDTKVFREESLAYPEVEAELIDDDHDEHIEHDPSISLEDLQQQQRQSENGEQSVATDEKEEKSVKFRVTEMRHIRRVVRKTSTEPFKVCIDVEHHPHTIKHMFVPLALNDFATVHTRMQAVTIIPLEERLAQPGLTLSRALVSKEVAAFWAKWCGVLPQAREDIWDAFNIGLKRYFQLLKDRAQLNKKINTLRKQNEDLKHLLQNNCKENKQGMKKKLVLKDDSQIVEDDLLPKLHLPAIKLTFLKPGKAEQPKLPPIKKTEGQQTMPPNKVNKVKPQHSK